MVNTSERLAPLLRLITDAIRLCVNASGGRRVRILAVGYVSGRGPDRGIHGGVRWANLVAFYR